MPVTSNHQIALEIDYAHEDAGWINCWLTIDGQRHHLDASGALPPFNNLLHFVKALAIQHLPVKTVWLEEGPWADFQATSAEGDQVHLNIKYVEEDAPWIDADVNRTEVIQALLLPLVDMANYFPASQTEWELPRAVVQKVQSIVDQRSAAQETPVFSEASALLVDFILYRGDAASDGTGESYMELWIQDEVKNRFYIRDTDPFWPNWFQFLENIIQARLPAECEHVTRFSLLFDEDETPLFISTSLFQAEPMPDERNFILRMVVQEQDKERVSLQDSMFDRRQFVLAFVHAFEKFLREESQVPKAITSARFDLWTLPLDRLIALLG